ncbi:hypothetical protein KBB68_01460 [Candidatus Babeliales bacterium]|nr:hypothetical protein [Candidatus Babeliales bacterium]
MNKKVFYLAILIIVPNINAKFFLRTSHQIFYKTLKEAVRYSDAKVIYLIMLGCPSLQNACLHELHTNSSRLLKVKLITDCKFDLWRYPYFSQAYVGEQKKYANSQSALIMGSLYKPLIAFETKSRFLTYESAIINNRQDLELIKKEFEQRWENLKNDK